MRSYALELVSLPELKGDTSLLSGREMEKYGSFKIEKRRRDWLGARIALKLAVRKHLPSPPPETAIEALPDADGRPHLVLEGRQSPLPISLTHSGNYAGAALSLGGLAAIGMDIEVVEERPRSWAEDCFTPAELAIAGGSARSLTAFWTRKEAVLKALGLGLSVDLKEIDVSAEKPACGGKLKERWRAMNSPEVTLETPAAVPPGYELTVALLAGNPGNFTGTATPNGGTQHGRP